jgi:hypothetical protein
MNEPRVREVARSERSSAAPIQAPAVEGDAFAEYRGAGAFAGPRMVSDNIFTFERGGESISQSPFDVVAASREDSLARENELLKRRIQRLERQVLMYRGMLDKERMQRLNMSLP